MAEIGPDTGEHGPAGKVYRSGTLRKAPVAVQVAARSQLVLHRQTPAKPAEELGTHPFRLPPAKSIL